MTNLMQWYTSNPEEVAKLIRAIDFRMNGVAIDGVSAEDIVHDVVVYRGDYPITSKSAYSAVYGVALSRLRDVMRRKSVAMSHLADGSFSVQIVSPSAEVEALELVASDAIGRLLSRLTTRQQQVMGMYLQGLSLVAIAEQMGASVGTVKSLRNRAIAQLKKFSTE